MKKNAAKVVVAGLLVAALVYLRAAHEPRVWRGRPPSTGEVPPPGPDSAPARHAASPRPEDVPGKGSPEGDPSLAPAALTPLALWREAERRAGEDFEAALRWARMLPKVLDRDRALSCLSLNLCGIAGMDALRAVELASEIQDPAIRLHAQGEVAHWWVHLEPAQALAWAVSLPESAVSSTPPQDESERMLYTFFNSRRSILMNCIGAWTAPIQYEEGVKEVPGDKIEAARRWIDEAPLLAEVKGDLLRCLPKAQKR